MWYQMVHHTREVNGALSRIPDIEHLLYQQSPLLGWFSGSRPADVPAAAAELTRLAREWPISTVIVHLGWLEPNAALPILGFLNTHPALCFWLQERDLVVYRERSRGCPTPAPGQALHVDFGQQGDEPYLVDGWYARENVGGVGARWSRQTAQITALLTPATDYELTLRALGYGESRRITVRANDVEIGTLDLPEDWATYTLRLPASAIGPSGELRLTLAANGELSPATRSQSADTRMLAAAYQRLTLKPLPPNP
jgi:hypothetical protein